jgi:hypothetical protein
MNEGDGTGWAGIEADLSSLRTLALQLRAEVEAGLTPRTKQAFPPFESGAGFGAGSPSADLYAVRQKYHDCLTAAIDQLLDQMDSSTRLVDVVADITTRYGSIDALASVTLKDLQAAFVQADQADRARRFGAGASPKGGL